MDTRIHAVDITTIALVLESLEEEIITKLINRIQFAYNDVIYQPGRSGFENDTTHSLFELRLRAHEHMDARFGRFCVPEERPFTTDLPAAKRRVSLDTGQLHIDDNNRINLCPEILARYRQLLPILCDPGDDGQYGSSVEHDVYALQAIARRVHFGALYVAESKFRSDPGGFGALVAHNDLEGIEQKLTRSDVEATILSRVQEKVKTMQMAVNTRIRKTIDPAIVHAFYRDHIIPLTKKGEVRYLLHRSG
jgi:chorismate mutase